MKKLKRRDFFHSGCILAGSAALAACTGDAGKTEALNESRGELARSASSRTDLTVGMTREQVMVLLDMKVGHYMQTTHHCAQSSFLALRDVFGFEDGAIVKALTAVPGIAEKGETCGAVVGPLMAFGLLYGAGEPGDRSVYDRVLKPSGDFYDRVVESEGSTKCAELLESRLGRKFDLRKSEDLKAYRAADGPARCTLIVQNVVRIAAGIILDEQERRG